MVIGTSHAKIILELLLQNDKAKAFSRTRIEKIKKFDHVISKVGNKFYGIDHITANVINIYYAILG